MASPAPLYQYFWCLFLKDTADFQKSRRVPLYVTNEPAVTGTPMQTMVFDLYYSCNNPKYAQLSFQNSSFLSLLKNVFALLPREKIVNSHYNHLLPTPTQKNSFQVLPNHNSTERAKYFFKNGFPLFSFEDLVKFFAGKNLQASLKVKSFLSTRMIYPRDECWSFQSVTGYLFICHQCLLLSWTTLTIWRSCWQGISHLWKGSVGRWKRFPMPLFPFQIPGLFSICARGGIHHAFQW